MENFSSFLNKGGHEKINKIDAIAVTDLADYEMILSRNQDKSWFSLVLSASFAISMGAQSRKLWRGQLNDDF
ncbi:hypothetical protein [Nostoc sp. FACHB-145]|uniref:hypothetical protein n=1 Tax=Nostoc sp. FACHB-145 TaxID=2692836 RepID=UPI001687DACE|nr:hypothetical protein [Nostoc sp. FACHB-145]MBD2467734.1 hypothetical protein [Nostoc sp. FACHB-145]